MIYYELIVTVRLTKDMPYYISQSIIAKNINRSMLLDQDLKKLHGRRGYKNYVFCNFYPMEKDKIYHKNYIYLFNLRSPNRRMLLKIKYLLPKTSVDFQVLATEIRTYSNIFISEISNITPAIATINTRYWITENGIDLLMKRIHVNAVKKTKDYMNPSFEEPKENFIQYIEQINRKPIRLSYKRTNLIGNRFRIGVKTDKASQLLAQMIVATGLLEKNTLGAGYCLFK